MMLVYSGQMACKDLHPNEIKLKSIIWIRMKKIISLKHPHLIGIVTGWYNTSKTLHSLSQLVIKCFNKTTSTDLVQSHFILISRDKSIKFQDSNLFLLIKNIKYMEETNLMNILEWTHLLWQDILSLHTMNQVVSWASTYILEGQWWWLTICSRCLRIIRTLGIMHLILWKLEVCWSKPTVKKGQTPDNLME